MAHPVGDGPQLRALGAAVGESPRPPQLAPTAGLGGRLPRLAVAGGVEVVPRIEALRLGEDTPPALARAPSPPPPAAPCPLPARFRDAFVGASKRTKVPLPLLTAMAYEESRMDPKVRSRAGAEGLLQLMPATARELRLDPTVPRSNVLAGARYLQRLLRRFHRLDLALSAYNAGPAAVARAGGGEAPPTVAYVAAVRTRAAALGHCR